MTPVERCRDCGKLFPYLARGVCRPCLEEREARFYRVRDWFRANAGMSVADAAEANDVSVALITEWINEGRLARTHAAPDDTIAALHEEERRREEIRRALVESGASLTPPSTREPAESKPKPSHGMYGRRH